MKSKSSSDSCPSPPPFFCASTSPLTQTPPAAAPPYSTTRRRASASVTGKPRRFTCKKKEQTAKGNVGSRSDWNHLKLWKSVESLCCWKYECSAARMPSFRPHLKKTNFSACVAGKPHNVVDVKYTEMPPSVQATKPKLRVTFNARYLDATNSAA